MADITDNMALRFADSLERIVFTAARNWERRVTINREERDAIVTALRKGAALSQKTKEG